jgi:hypothetical protein
MMEPRSVPELWNSLINTLFGPGVWQLIPFAGIFGLIVLTAWSLSRISRLFADVRLLEYRSKEIFKRVSSLEHRLEELQEKLEAKPAVWEEIAELKHRIVVLEQRNE